MIKKRTYEEIVAEIQEQASPEVMARCLTSILFSLYGDTDETSSSIWIDPDKEWDSWDSAAEVLESIEEDLRSAGLSVEDSSSEKLVMPREYCDSCQDPLEDGQIGNCGCRERE